MIKKYLDIKLSRTLNKIPKGPAIVHIETTKKCNLRCQMCDIWRKKSKKELTISEFRNLANEFKKMSVMAIGLTGGEPMLRRDIKEIIKIFKNKGMIVHINTNGTIPNTAKRLKDSGVDSVTVSIDLYGKEHDKSRGMKGTFEKAIKTLKELKKAKIKRIGIGTLIMGQNPKNFEKLTKLAKDLGIFISFAGFDLGLVSQQQTKRKKQFQKFVEGIREIKRLRKKYKNIMVLPAYLDYMKKQSTKPKIIKWCYAGYVTCIIRANGDVTPCYKPKVAGNIRKNKFRQIWNSKKMNELRQNMRKGCPGCFANCTIEPSLIFSKIRAAVQFYRLKWSKVK